MKEFLRYIVQNLAIRQKKKWSDI